MGAAEFYAVISITSIFDIDFSQVMETSIETVRRSLDNTKFIIKWNIEPSFIKDGTVVPLETLTHQECIDLTKTPEWSSNGH